MLAPRDVARSRFTPVVFMSGYHMGDVDEYLENAERQLTVRARG